MIEWIITALTMFGIGEGAKAIDRYQTQKENRYSPLVVPVVQPPQKAVRYKNTMKQMMYEKYLIDLKSNPQWAAFQVKHNGYGGFVFDNTEN